MRKVARILGLVMLVTLLSVSTVFAGTLNIVEVYPEDGQTGVALENFGVQINFDSTFEGDLGTVNDDCFTLVGPKTVDSETVEAYEFPLKVLYSDTNPNMILVLVDKDDDGNIVTLESNENYTFTIKAGLVDDSGNTLDKDITYTFTTVNQQRNNTVNTLLMLVMMGGMMFFTMRAGKKTEKKEEKNKSKEPVNPYKEAKKKGKSVEEVVSQEAKKKKKEEEKKKKAPASVDDKYIYLDKDEYYVTTIRRVDPEKSTYVKKYKEKKQAEREAELKRKAELKAKRKAQKKK